MWIKKALPDTGEIFFIDGKIAIEFTHPQIKGRNFWNVTILGVEYNSEYPVSLKNFDLRDILENKKNNLEHNAGTR